MYKKEGRRVSLSVERKMALDAESLLICGFRHFFSPAQEKSGELE